VKNWSRVKWHSWLTNISTSFVFLFNKQWLLVARKYCTSATALSRCCPRHTATWRRFDTFIIQNEVPSLWLRAHGKLNSAVLCYRQSSLELVSSLMTVLNLKLENFLTTKLWTHCSNWVKERRVKFWGRAIARLYAQYCHRNFITWTKGTWAFSGEQDWYFCYRQVFTKISNRQEQFGISDEHFSTFEV